MKFTSIDTAEINLSDERFRISYFFSLKSLQQSIKAAGLINPPVLTYRDRQPVIVSGWKRILACQKLSLTPIPVFVCDKDDLETFKISVHENLTHREYCQIEKAEILHKLKLFGEDEDCIVRQFLPLLKIPPTKRHLSIYLTFSRFEPELKKITYDKNMQFNVMQYLVHFKPKERQTLLPFLIPLGQNKQKELLADLYEIIRKEKVSAAKILNTDSIKAIQSNKKLSPLQKADRIRAFLREKRNPTLATWAKAFDAVLKELNLSQGIVITPSPFFEGEDFSLNFDFKSREELIEKLARLKELSAKKELLDLFKFSSDD